MKLLKKIGLVVLILLLLLCISTFFMPRATHVERSLVMQAPSDVIFAEVNTMKSWEKWSPWHRIDPQMKITYFGPEKGTGSGYSWVSTNSNVGKGKMTLASSTADSIITVMDFEGQGTSVAGFQFSKEGTGTKVTWFLRSEMGMNPIRKIFGLLMDKLVGPSFEKGLKSLDSVSTVEAKNGAVAVAKKFNIQQVTVEPLTVMTYSSTSPLDSLGPKLGMSFMKIGKVVKTQGLSQSGPVFAIYHVYSPEKIEFEAGVPVNKAGKKEGAVFAKELPKTNALLIDYYGPYNDGMHAAHEQIQTFAKENNKDITGAPWEVYVGDPGKESDPSKVLTKIYYPVK
jgi:effector-binding domain-containing protein/carbon monoxide dehydrogenase subunit G